VLRLESKSPPSKPSYHLVITLLLFLAFFLGFISEFPIPLRRSPAILSLVIFAGLSLAYFLAAFLIRPLRRIEEDLSRGIAEGLKPLSGQKWQETETIVRFFNLLIARINELENKVGEESRELKTKMGEAEARSKSLEDTKTALLNVLEDIEKEKRNSEFLAADLQKFKLAVENASDQIMILSPEMKILYANRAAELTTGYSLREMIGRSPDLWRLKIPEKVSRDMNRAINLEKVPFSTELENRRKNGDLYISEFKISPILDDRNQIEFFVVVERDITRAKEIDRAKNEFVSLASHQLRTPLSIVNWYAEMLAEGDVGPLKPKQEEYIQEIHRTNHRMIDLVNALLNVSRIDMGTLPFETKELDLVKLAEDILAIFSRQIKQKRLLVEKKYPGKVLRLTADPNLLMIIMQNLISNAVKYDREGGRILIELERSDGRVLIKVADNGIGIPEEQQSKIFTKLFRADNARRVDPDGSGLGLYLTKAAVEKSGGRIWFESIFDKGTNFFVDLPLVFNEKVGESKKE